MDSLPKVFTILFALSSLARVDGAVSGLQLSVDTNVIEAGDTVNLVVNVTQDFGTNQTLYAYVNGKQWGSGAQLSPWKTAGVVTILLPLPNPSPATEIQVASEAPAGQFYFVGLPIPEGAVVSNVVTVQVSKRVIAPLPPAKMRFGMELEQWFMPLNAPWELAEATPLVGRYNSCDSDVIVQHAIWFAEMGIDFVLVDWTNNIWNTPHWNDRSPGVNYLIEGFLCLIDTYAELLAGGLIPVPKVLLLLGLDNGVQATMECLNEEIAYIYSNLTSNAKYTGLWEILDGKPLLIPFDGANEHSKMSPPIDDRFFTIRWMSTQLQDNGFGADGLWSWMDGTLTPPPAVLNGTAEALTITNAFFADGGWLAPTARGQLGGTTLLEEFKQAVAVQPEFLVICQWNEFIGQAAGQGYGPNHSIYVDIFNVTFSNDMEPTSLSESGYRSTRGGWGMWFVNAMRALRDLFQQLTQPDLSGLPAEPIILLAIASPDRETNVTQTSLLVQWSVIGPYNGPRAITYDIMLNGVTLASGITAQNYTLSLSAADNGPAVLSVAIADAQTYYPLSVDKVDRVPLANPVPLTASIPINIVL